MNGETINPHLPLNIICDHIVPTRPVNNDNGLSEVSQTSGRLAPRSKTSGRLFEFSYFPPPKFDNRVRIAMAMEYFLCARARLTILPASACLTLPTIERVLYSEHNHFPRLREEVQSQEENPVCWMINPQLLTVFHFAKTTTEGQNNTWPVSNLWLCYLKQGRLYNT